MFLAFVIVTTVNFNQSAYSVYENDGYVQPVLVLSKPYSSDFTITIREDSGTASGELGIYNLQITRRVVDMYV